MRNNISFYGTTALAVQFMLKSKIKKCTEIELDDFVSKLEKDELNKPNDNEDEAWMCREYWYISESYSNLGLTVKADKYRHKSKDHLNSVSLLISDSVIRKDYIEMPLIHQLIR